MSPFFPVMRHFSCLVYHLCTVLHVCLLFDCTDYCCPVLISLHIVFTVPTDQRSPSIDLTAIPYIYLFFSPSPIQSPNHDTYSAETFSELGIHLLMCLMYTIIYMTYFAAVVANEWFLRFSKENTLTQLTHGYIPKLSTLKYICISYCLPIVRSGAERDVIFQRIIIRTITQDMEHVVQNIQVVTCHTICTGDVQHNIHNIRK